MSFRNSLVSSGVLILAFVLLSQGVAFGQATANLLVPEKKLRLACAEATEDGKIKIVRSQFTQKVVTIQEKDGKSDAKGKIDLDDGEKKADAKDIGKMKLVTETVTQTYTVKIPVTEVVTVDGKEVSVTKFRTEQRTREVPITRISGQKGAMRSVPIKISVPYTTTIVEDGKHKTVTRERIVTQMRMIAENQKVVTVTKPVSKTYESGALKYFKLDGSELSVAEARDLLRERRPIIMVGKDGKLDPYFQRLVRSETVLIHESGK